MAARIELRLNEFDVITGLRGWFTDEERARRIGVDPATMCRIRKGRTLPGERFIAGVLWALPEIEFDHLFEVIDDRTTSRVPMIEFRSYHYG